MSLRDADTTKTPGRAEVYANGPPPMRVQLTVGDGEPIGGERLLDSGRTHARIPE